MINRAVLGMNAKTFREINNINNEQTKDGVVIEKLNDLDFAQKMNAKLISAGLSHNERESIIQKSFK